MDATVTCSVTLEPVGLAEGVLLPAVGRHVQAVVDRRAAEGEEAVAEGVPGGPAHLGDGEGDEPPAPVPAPAGGVLGVGEALALDRLAERGHARLGGGVRRPPGRCPPARTGPRRRGGAGTSGAVRSSARRPRPPGSSVVHGDGAVVAGHAEHQHPGRNLDGRSGHDRSLPDRLGAVNRSQSRSAGADGGG